MKIAVATLLCIFLVYSFSYAIDEDIYVRLTADSIIFAHKHRGNYKALNLWMDAMKGRYPEIATKEWRAFEEKLARDSTLKNRIYARIVDHIKAQGYNAKIVDLGGGRTTVEIEE